MNIQSSFPQVNNIPVDQRALVAQNKAPSRKASSSIFVRTISEITTFFGCGKKTLENKKVTPLHSAKEKEDMAIFYKELAKEMFAHFGEHLENASFQAFYQRFCFDVDWIVEKRKYPAQVLKDHFFERVVTLFVKMYKDLIKKGQLLATKDSPLPHWLVGSYVPDKLPDNFVPGFHNWHRFCFHVDRRMDPFLEDALSHLKESTHHSSADNFYQECLAFGSMLRHEIDVFSAFVNYIKREPFQSIVNYTDSILGRGVCLGASFARAVEGIKKPTTAAAIMPTAQARYIQAAYIVSLCFGLRNGLENPHSIWEQSKDALFARHQVQEKNIPFSKVKIEEFFPHLETLIKKERHAIVSVSKEGALWNQPMQAWSLTMAFVCKLQKLFTDVILRKTKPLARVLKKEDYIEIEHRMTLFHGPTENAISTQMKNFDGFDDAIKELPLKRRDLTIATLKIEAFQYLIRHVPNNMKEAFRQFLQEDSFIKEFVAERVEHRLGKDAPSPVFEKETKWVEKQVENILAALELGTSEEEKQIYLGHAIYCKLSAPFELQDVNVPGFDLFQTSDKTQFKRYFVLWSLLQPFSHIEAVKEITPIGN